MKKLIWLLWILVLFLLIVPSTFARNLSITANSGFSTNSLAEFQILRLNFSSRITPLQINFTIANQASLNGLIGILYLNTSDVPIGNATISEHKISFSLAEGNRTTGGIYYVVLTDPITTATKAFKSALPFNDDDVSAFCSRATTILSQTRPSFMNDNCIAVAEVRSVSSFEFSQETSGIQQDLFDHAMLIQHFDEPLGLDNSTHANNANVLTNVNIRNDTGCKVGSCASFNGATSIRHAAIPAYAIKGNNWSMTCWYNTTSQDTNELFSKFDGGGTFNLQLDLSVNNINFQTHRQFVPDSNSVTCDSTGVDGIWTMFTGTFNNLTNEVIQYSNATQCSSATRVSPTNMLGAIPIEFGARQLGSDRPYEGALDECIVFNKTLTQADINFLFNEGKGLSLSAAEAVDNAVPTFGDSSRTPQVPNNGEVVRLSQVISDETSLSGFKFAHNQTGILTNSSLFTESSTSTNATFNLTVTLTAGGVVGFEWWANDTSANTAISALQTFTVGDSTSPTFGATSINNSNPKINDGVALSQVIDDDIQLLSFRFSENSSGIFVNQSTVFISGTTFNASVNASVTLTRGNVVGIQWWANDTSGNTDVSAISTFTVANTPPEIPTILFPNDKLRTNTLPLDLNVTFAADADSDSITITYYINGTINATSSGNVSIQAGDGDFVLNVDLNDGFDSSSANATVSFTVDLINPIITVTLPINNSVHNSDISVDMSASDSAIFLINYTLFNASDVIIRSAENNTNDSIPVGGVLRILDTIPVTGLGSGVYTMNITASDLHTNRVIPPYIVTPVPNGLRFQTAEGNDITFVQTLGQITGLPNARRLIDRYEVNFGTFPIFEPRVFNVTIPAGELKVIKNSEFKGHIVAINPDGTDGNWIDFENDDPDSIVFAQNINKHEVTVVVFSTDFNFNSVGGLNTVTEQIILNIDVTVPTSDIVISNSTPDELDSIQINVTCADDSALFNVTIQNNETGTFVAVNFSTLSGTNVTFIHNDTALGETIGFRGICSDIINTAQSEITYTGTPTPIPVAITGLAVLPLENVSNLVGMVVLLLIIIGVIFGAKSLGGTKK